MRRLTLGLTVMVLITLTACGSDDPDAASSTSSTEPAADTSELSGTFVSTAVTGHELVAGSQITMTFDGDALSYSAGCNQMGAGFEVTDSTLTLDGPARSTMMGCEPDLQAQDEWLTELLTAGVTFELASGVLTLSADGVTITLESDADQSAGDGSISLAGTSWTLESIIQGDAASSVPAGVDPPTLIIDDRSNATVTTGCNSGGTAVTVQDTTVTFVPMRLTMKACEGAAATVEAAVTSVLDGESSATIEGDELTLTKGATALVYRAT